MKRTAAVEDSRYNRGIQMNAFTVLIDQRWKTLPVLGCLLLTVFTGCHRQSTQLDERLHQRAYLWQREWSPAVVAAVPESRGRVDGLIVLAGEVQWKDGRPVLMRSSVKWDALKSSGIPISLAMRIAPFGGPFEAGDSITQFLAHSVLSLCEEARRHGVLFEEFQIDFDCAQKKLTGYALWLKAIRGALKETPLVITALPSWLDESGFRSLVSNVDRYVLQVHSVPISDRQVALCDVEQARRWMVKASAIGRPFSLAMPTYSCLAGYRSDGQFLGMVMDSVQPSWPPDTRIQEFASDPVALSKLVHECQTNRPANLREIVWYRLPVKSDLRNWRWPTLSAVMDGRSPKTDLQIRLDGSNPVDVTLENAGETNEPPDYAVSLQWTGSTLTAYDAFPGWKIESKEGRAIFRPDSANRHHFGPGEKRPLGWLRFDRETVLETKITD